MLFFSQARWFGNISIWDSGKSHVIVLKVIILDMIILIVIEQKKAASLDLDIYFVFSLCACQILFDKLKQHHFGYFCRISSSDKGVFQWMHLLNWRLLPLYKALECAWCFLLAHLAHRKCCQLHYLVSTEKATHYSHKVLFRKCSLPTSDWESHCTYECWQSPQLSQSLDLMMSEAGQGTGPEPSPLLLSQLVCSTFILRNLE